MKTIERQACNLPQTRDIGFEYEHITKNKVALL